MMNTRLLNSLPLAIPVSILTFAVFLVTYSSIQLDDTLAMGIIYDLTLTSPILYLIAIWKTKTPKITAVPVFILGIVIATFLIPEDKQFHLNLIKNFLLPVVELSVLGLVIYKVNQGKKAFSKSEESDYYFKLKTAAKEILPSARVANILATEIGMIYYALISWKKSKPRNNQFTYHKENGAMALMFIIIVMILVETIALHFLLIRWNEAVAWVLFVLSLYTALQILGHAKAMKRRFIEVSDANLILKYGLFGDIAIPLELIDQILPTSKDLDESQSKNAVRLSLLGEMESHNCIIHLKDMVTITGAYGLKKTGSIILLSIDDKNFFTELLDQKIALRNSN
ncbi:hypothetical protein [Marinoscillum pacificum]|uniref:hypothetical protein n=1 Tax=Marinoscillum pacificum TaxID=392723 RepID=UPI002157BD25|nr:hypothetical protein [Marinoscillum pacificum]